MENGNKERLSSHDVARIQVVSFLTESTIRRVFKGKGSRGSRARVAEACRKLGLAPPAAPQMAEGG